jgi:hypothetical protein
METITVKRPPEQCVVCADTMNQSTRHPIPCSACGFVCCQRCVIKYILGSINDVTCMSCREPWSVVFLMSHMPKSFIQGEYKKHRENVLLDREKAMLPDTMVYAEAAKRRAFFEAQRNRLRIHIANMYQKEMGMSREIWRVPRTFEQHEHHIDQVTLIRDDVARCRVQIQRVEYLMTHLDSFVSNQLATMQKKFICRCPKIDCRGFVSTSNDAAEDFQCKLCNTRVCEHCHASLPAAGDDVHLCMEDDVQTAALLKRDTKGCPTCATPIHKIEGCDQMFCTQCRTAFSWHTLEIDSGRVHNPHYYEYLRQRDGGFIRRELGDIPCGGLPSTTELLTFIQTRRIIRIDTNAHISKESTSRSYLEAALLTASIDVMEKLLPIQMREANHTGADFNRDLRVAFLCNKIDEDTWKKTLQRREKAKCKAREYAEVLHTYVIVVSDLFRTLFASLPDPVGHHDHELYQHANDVADNIVVEMKAIHAYCDQAMKTVAKRYGSLSPPEFKWRFRFGRDNGDDV